jgi:hypothetical protein
MGSLTTQTLQSLGVSLIQSTFANTTGNWDAVRESPAVLYEIVQRQGSPLSCVHSFRFGRKKS